MLASTPTPSFPDRRGGPPPLPRLSRHGMNQNNQNQKRYKIPNLVDVISPVEVRLKLVPDDIVDQRRVEQHRSLCASHRKPSAPSSSSAAETKPTSLPHNFSCQLSTPSSSRPSCSSPSHRPPHLHLRHPNHREAAGGPARGGYGVAGRR